MSRWSSPIIRMRRFRSGSALSLAAQFREVIIVDNHSGPDDLAVLATLAAKNTNLVVIANSENLGIAAALNQGCRAAAQSGAIWVAQTL